MQRSFNFFAISLLSATLVSAASANSIRAIELGNSVRVTEPNAGVVGTFMGLTWAHADPVNSRRLMLCGLMQSPGTSTAVGYVYVSEDAGNTWRRAIRDNSGRWVSEESCAYGHHGRIYYASSWDNTLAKTLGFHLYASDTAGKTWRKTYAYANWLDLSYVTPVPDTNAVSDRVVVFANHVSGRGRVFPLSPAAIVLSHNGEVFSGMIGASDAHQRLNVLAYGSVDLANGDALFSGRAQTGIGLEVDVFHYSLKDDALSLRATLAHYPFRYLPIGNAAINPGPSMAVDKSAGRFRGRVYVAWTTINPRTVREKAASTVWLATSDDNGKRWAVRPVLQRTGIWSRHTCDGKSLFNAVQIAVNAKGILGVLWSENDSTLLFAFSEDGGDTFSRSSIVAQYRTGLGKTYVDAITPGTGGNYYLADRVAYSENGIKTAPHTMNDLLKRRTAPAELGFGVLIRRQSLSWIPLVADANGVFHAFWNPITSTNALFTRTITVGQENVHHHDLQDPVSTTSCALIDYRNVHPAARTLPQTVGVPPGFHDATSSISIDEQATRYIYDDRTHNFRLTLHLLSGDAAAFKKPLIILATDLHSDFGKPLTENARGTLSGKSATGGIPVTFVFHINRFALPISWFYGAGDYVAARLRVFEKN